MLLANILVAEHLFKTCKDKTILRAHDEITGSRQEQMINYFNKVGIDINMSSPAATSQSIERLKIEAKDSELI